MRLIEYIYISACMSLRVGENLPANLQFRILLQLLQFRISRQLLGWKGSMRKCSCFEHRGACGTIPMRTQQAS
jgi:hypothetical protein